MKSRIYNILHGYDQSRIALNINYFIIFVILLNLALVVYESMPAYQNADYRIFYWVDVASVAVFTVEYFLRLITCTEDPRYSHPIKGRIRYAFTPMAIVDFLAVFPFFLPFFYIDLRFLRVLRIFRMFRIVKIIRYSDSIKLFQRVIAKKSEELISSLLLLSIMVILSACIIYFVENEAQPDVFSSIPASCWWSVITLTTIGYGDMVPITTLGKAIGSVAALFGIGIYALAVGILVTGFMDEFNESHKKIKRCPHCKKKLDSDHKHTSII